MAKTSSLGKIAVHVDTLSTLLNNNGGHFLHWRAGVDACRRDGALRCARDRSGEGRAGEGKGEEGDGWELHFDGVGG
jgi:hypothetical protein